MSSSKQLTVQLSNEDFAVLEAEAQKLNTSSEVMAYQLLRSSLLQIKASHSHQQDLETLQQLRELGKKLPLADVVSLVRESRDELGDRV